MKLVILDDWEKQFSTHPTLTQLQDHFEIFIYHDEPSTEDLIERIKDADVIIPIRERTKFTKDILQQLKNIKLIAQTGAGLAHIDVEEATRLNIPVSTTPGGSSSVIELIFGFMIAYSRKLLTLDHEMKQGNWLQSVGFGLEGKTIGIIGLGKIGSGVARVAKAFNMNVVAWGPRLTPERAMQHEVNYCSLDELVSSSHFIVLAVRYVPETKHLLTSSHFSKMRSDAFLINTSRGEVVEETALLQALKENQIAGAGLDVFKAEPLPADHPFLKLDNVLLTPHIGWKTDRMFDRFLTVSIENILSYVVEQTPKRIVNMEALETVEQK